MLDVKNSFVVAREVVFKNEASASRKLDMHKESGGRGGEGRGGGLHQNEAEAQWDNMEHLVWAFALPRPV